MSIPIQGHRGAGGLEAENTREAVELGWSLGLIPEIDVGTTADGVIVGFHDHDLARVVRDPPPGLRGRSVRDLAWAELRGLDVGLPGRPRAIPALRDVLDLLRARPADRLYLDLKRVDLAALAALVEARGVAGQVVVATNRDPWIAEWRRLQPRGETLRWVWMEPGTAGWERAAAELAALRAAGFPGVTQLQLHVLVDAAGAFQPGEERIRALAAELAGRGILFQAFPHAGGPEVYRRLLVLGARSFATDHPEAALAGTRGA